MFFIYVCEELIIQIFNFQKHSYNLNKFFFKFTKILQRKKTVVFSLPLWLTSSLRYRKSGNELFFSLPPQRQLEVNVHHTIVLEEPFFVFDTWRSEWFKSNYFWDMSLADRTWARLRRNRVEVYFITDSTISGPSQVSVVVRVEGYARTHILFKGRFSPVGKSCESEAKGDGFGRWKFH